jgi:hypothetical protein
MSKMATAGIRVLLVIAYQMRVLISYEKWVQRKIIMHVLDPLNLVVTRIFVLKCNPFKSKVVINP